jgi:hypothetical protein
MQHVNPDQLVRKSIYRSVGGTRDHFNTVFLCIVVSAPSTKGFPTMTQDSKAQVPATRVCASIMKLSQLSQDFFQFGGD